MKAAQTFDNEANKPNATFLLRCSCKRLQIGLLLITVVQVIVFFVLHKTKHSVNPSDILNLTQDFSVFHEKHKTSTFIETPKNSSFDRPRILLIIGIITFYKKSDRRQVIRETWLNQAKNREDIVVRFYTDSPNFLDQQSKEDLDRESQTYGDLVYMPHAPGINFGVRLLWILEQLYNQYNFSYFLRLDDDHFLCLERLLYELPSRPTRALYWGFIHCHPRVVRVDEAWALLSYDLVEEFVQKSNTSLMCNPFGDQSLALWIDRSNKNVTYFMDNTRIVHKSSARDPKYLKPNVCEKFLSLHGSYPTTMRKYWILTQNFRKRWRNPKIYEIHPIPNFSIKCGVNKKFDWMGFIPKYRFEPKLCSSNPTWEITYQKAETREEGERYTNY